MIMDHMEVIFRSMRGMNYLYIIMLCVLCVSCVKDDDAAIDEDVMILFNSKASVDGAESDGDLIGVSLVDEYKNLFFGQYKVENGEIQPNGDEFFVKRTTFTIMYSGILSGTKDENDNLYTEVEKPDDTTYDGCNVYVAHRIGEDENGVEDIYVGVPDVNYISYSGNALQYNSTNRYYYHYILDAGIKLKQQYSKMQFSLQSDKESGHTISDVGVTNLIKRGYVCPVHGLHYDPEKDMDDADIKLTYGTADSDGGVVVIDAKVLTCEGDEEGYVEILSGDYTDIDPVTQKRVLTSPYLYVTYTGSTPLTNQLPIMVDLEPQMRYKFVATLTNVQINVQIYKIGEWENGVADGDGDGEVTKVADYAVKVTAPNGWDGNYEIAGDISNL